MFHTLVDCNDNECPRKYFSVTLGTITLKHDDCFVQKCLFTPKVNIRSKKLFVLLLLVTVGMATYHALIVYDSLDRLVQERL